MLAGSVSLLLVASAQAVAAPLSGLVRFGYENGGDDIATLEFDDGDSEDIRAGGELFIEGGARLYWSDRPLIDRIGAVRPSPPLPGDAIDAHDASLRDRMETELTIGYKVASVTADNADIRFDRTTLQLLQFYRFGAVRAGLGVTWHRAPELHLDLDESIVFGGDADAPPERLVADDAAGTMIAIDYSFDPRFHVGLRATFIDYDTDSGSRNANSVGFYAGAAF